MNELNITSITFNYQSDYILDTGKVVPKSPSNRHHAEIQEWIADGGVVAPYVPPVEIQMTNTQKLEIGTGMVVAEIKTVLGI